MSRISSASDSHAADVKATSVSAYRPMSPRRATTSAARVTPSAPAACPLDPAPITATTAFARGSVTPGARRAAVVRVAASTLGEASAVVRRIVARADSGIHSVRVPPVGTAPLKRGGATPTTRMATSLTRMVLPTTSGADAKLSRQSVWPMTATSWASLASRRSSSGRPAPSIGRTPIVGKKPPVTNCTCASRASPSPASSATEWRTQPTTDAKTSRWPAKSRSSREENVRDRQRPPASSCSLPRIATSASSRGTPGAGRIVIAWMSEKTPA